MTAQAHAALSAFSLEVCLLWWAERWPMKGHHARPSPFLSCSQNIACHLGNTSSTCSPTRAARGRRRGKEVPDTVGTSSFLPFPTWPTDLVRFQNWRETGRTPALLSATQNRIFSHNTLLRVHPVLCAHLQCQRAHYIMSQPVPLCISQTQLLNPSHVKLKLTSSSDASYVPWSHRE